MKKQQALNISSKIEQIINDNARNIKIEGGVKTIEITGEENRIIVDKITEFLEIVRTGEECKYNKKSKLRLFINKLI